MPSTVICAVGAEKSTSAPASIVNEPLVATVTAPETFNTDPFTHTSGLRMERAATAVTLVQAFARFASWPAGQAHPAPLAPGLVGEPTKLKAQAEQLLGEALPTSPVVVPAGHAVQLGAPGTAE